MPPIPRRDYSIPQPSGFRLGTDGKRVPFPTIKRAALAIHNLVHRFFPTPGDSSARGGSATSVRVEPRDQTKPVGFIHPNWPKDPTAIILDKPGLFRKDT